MAANDVNIRIKAVDETKRAFDSVKGSLGGLKSAVFSVQGAIAGIAGGFIAKTFIDANVSFQRLEASLITFTGSADAAAAQFKILQDFASKTPFQLEEVVGGFNKLVARGINPTIQTFESFGNIAAGTGKTLDQFVEAVADAAVGEFERLKEFGIKARVEGDNVRMTFGGVTTQIGNNSNEILGYLEKLGNTKFAGGIELQARTLGGAFSKLQDAITNLAIAIGKTGINGLIVELTDNVTGLVNALTKNIEKASDPVKKLRDDWMTFNEMLGDVKNVEDRNKIMDEMNRITQEINKYTSKVVETKKAEIETTQTQTAELSKLATITVGYRDAVASVYAPGIMGKRLTSQEYVNTLIKEEKDMLPEVVSSLAVYEQSVKTLGDSLREVGDRGIQFVTDGLADMISGTKTAADAFRSMASSIIKDLIRMYVQSQITTPLAQMFGIGSFGSQAPAPMRVVNVNGNATGGPVQANRATMVGERGPELFVPNQSGAIIPNNKIGNGSGVTVVQNINVSTGVQQTVRAEVMSLMPQIANAAKSAVADAKLRGGSYAAALR